jgi:hypothetical protein
MTDAYAWLLWSILVAIVFVGLAVTRLLEQILKAILNYHDWDEKERASDHEQWKGPTT